MSKKIIKKFILLGSYQIIGGLFGLVLTFILFANQNSPSGLVLLIIAIMGIFFSYSIYCGILLVRKKISGLLHSKINQYLQLFSFASYGYAFQYASGFYFTIGTDLTNSFSLNLNMGLSTFQMHINSNSELLFINLNIVALFVILFIEGIKNKIIKEKLEIQIAEIGK